MLTANQILAELLESLSRQIRAAGKEDDFCTITVQPGNAIAFDFGPESDCRGGAWVRLVAANPTVSFPAADTSVNTCAYSLAYTMEIGMMFPAPVITDRLGNFVLPEDTEVFDAAMRQGDEMDLMFRAIRTANIPQLVIGDYAPLGPDGGVLGGTWTLTAGGDEDE
ncbi:hypothetical protein PP641_gp027 [Arthrobacter phage SilentRX]|uniref:Uncharacterized protein n=1 Tax=Arthrobacter phage SilentRX TaxID=2836091 RepID=A0A8F3EA13_9CAUD|nr:hypothetical protein PP641_gp027 [Arthrobacter phage SilentRX]QWY82768.1 hypothetical protein SEA_SILENTRX_27 [Arthrobacter phage SilentRX]